MANRVNSIKFFFCGSLHEPDYRNLKVTLVAIAALGLVALGVTLSLMSHPAISATCGMGIGLGIYAIWWRLKAPDGLSPLLFCCAVEQVMDQVPKGMQPGVYHALADGEIDLYAGLEQIPQSKIRRTEVVSINSPDEKAILRELAHKLKPDEFLLFLRQSDRAELFVLSRLGDEPSFSSIDSAILTGRHQVDLREFEHRPEYVIKELEGRLVDGEYVRVAFNQYRLRVVKSIITMNMAPRDAHEVDLETLRVRLMGATAGAAAAHEPRMGSRTDSLESVYLDAEG